MSLGRKMFIIPIKIFDVPEQIKSVLYSLSDEEYIAVKGGLAKAVLAQSLISKGKIRRNLALDNTSGKLDLDLVVTFVGTRQKNIDELNEKVTELTEKLKTVIQLKPEDVETFRGNLETDEKTLMRFLETRDMTFNEVVLIPRRDKWVLAYTDKCYRDTINAAAILSANGKGTMRYDYGRMVAGPYGICRMIRFLVEGKVGSIYLPKWWIERNNQEARRLNKENLGVYGMILTERYREEPKLQYTLMSILYRSELTDLKDFGIFRKEQEVFFKLQRNNEEFSFNHSRTFTQIQEHLIEKEEMRKISQSERKKAREKCKHKTMEKLKWSYRNRKYTQEYRIEKCTACSKVSVIPYGLQEPVWLNRLPYNIDLKRANVYHDPSGFFPHSPLQNFHKRY